MYIYTVMSWNPLKPSANGSQTTRNKKHNTKRFSTNAVASGIKQFLIRETCFHRNMCNTSMPPTVCVCCFATKDLTAYQQ